MVEKQNVVDGTLTEHGGNNKFILVVIFLCSVLSFSYLQ